MKQKLLRAIDSFVNLLYMMMKTSAAEFAQENFPNVVKNVWDNSKSDEENIKEIKEMFENNRVINEILGNTNVTEVIKAFQDGWLNKDF